MINKMEGRRKAKTTKVKEWRRLNNPLRRETDRAKEVYMEEICDQIIRSSVGRKVSNVSEGTTIRRKNDKSYKNISNRRQQL